MKYICAWCGSETAKPDGNTDDNIVSHGICDECLFILTETKEPQTQEEEQRNKGDIK